MSTLLDLELGDNDVNARTLRGYLVALLQRLWVDADEFSGKHPFGNSDWQDPVYLAMIREGIVDGAYDEDGYIEECDWDAADLLVLDAIEGIIRSAR